MKSPLSNADHVRFGEEVWEQKVNQIRIYSGTKYELINEADAGMVCAVTGLDHTYPGQGFGIEAQGETPVLEPVLHFRLILPERGAGSHAAKIAPDRGGRAGITYCMERKASGDPDPDHGRGPD